MISIRGRKTLQSRQLTSKQIRRFVTVVLCAITLCFYSGAKFQNQAVKGQELNENKEIETSLPVITDNNLSDTIEKKDFGAAAKLFASQRLSDFEQKADALIAKAEEEGKVRVIVGFRLDNYKLEGELTEQTRREQYEQIAQGQEAVLNSLASFKPENIKRLESVPYFGVTLTAEALMFLKNMPEVTSVVEDEIVRPALAESTQLIGAPAVWENNYTGNGWAVAVLDTGVEKTHSFLSGKVVSEACYSTNDSSREVSSLCPGGVTTSTATGSGEPCAGINGCDHGTHVAGIAAGQGSAFSGVARGANIIAIKVSSKYNKASDCPYGAPCVGAYNIDIALGLARVDTLRSSINIASVNLSLGSGAYSSNCDSVNPLITTLISNLRSVGIATIVASGNDYYTANIGFPACIASAVSVGSTEDAGTNVDKVSSFSNSASILTMLAPGSLINSSVPGGTFLNMSGTSMAAPHVAGAWAILKQRDASASVDTIQNLLTSTGKPVTDSRNNLVKPRIQIDRALYKMAMGCDTTGINVPNLIYLLPSLTFSDCSYIGTSQYVDLYTFFGTAGQKVAVTMNTNSFDTQLYLTNLNGQTIASNNNAGSSTNSRMPSSIGYLTLPANGTYVIHATSNGSGLTGSYWVNIARDTDCVLPGVSPLSQTFTYSSGSNQVRVTVPYSPCSWTATSNNSWITVPTYFPIGNGRANGDGSFTYSVSENTTGLSRRGTIFVNNRTFTVFQSAAPSAGEVTVSGRIFSIVGRGLSNATVYLTKSDGETVYARTNSFGYYRFENLSAGQSVIIGVNSKRFRFAPQTVNLTDNLAGVDFTPETN